MHETRSEVEKWVLLLKSDVGQIMLLAEGLKARSEVLEQLRGIEEYLIERGAMLTEMCDDLDDIGAELWSLYHDAKDGKVVDDVDADTLCQLARIMRKLENRHERHARHESFEDRINAELVEAGVKSSPTTPTTR